MGSPPSLPERERSCDVIYWDLYSPEAVLFLCEPRHVSWSRPCLEGQIPVLFFMPPLTFSLFFFHFVLAVQSHSLIQVMEVTIWGVGITLACLNLFFFFILNLSTFQLGVTHTNVICIPFFATWKALIEMLGRQDQEHSLFLGTECNIPNCNWYNHKNTMASQQGMGQPNYETVFVFTP